MSGIFEQVDTNHGSVTLQWRLLSCCFCTAAVAQSTAIVLPTKSSEIYPCSFRRFFDRLLEYLKSDADNEIKEADTRRKYAWQILMHAC